MNFRKRYLEEGFALLMAPALYPGFSSLGRHLEAHGIASKKELNDFKKRNSGWLHNYKTYDDLSGNLKRGAVAGSAIGLPLGTLLATRDGDDSLETGLGIGGLAIASGLGGGLLHTGIDRLFNQEKLKDVIAAKEKELMKKQKK